MRLFLPFKNLKDSSLVTSFLSSSQKGAASLVVVALLLAGITAAVYLTQTGTSFLPQAQEGPRFECSPDDLGRSTYSNTEGCSKTITPSHCEHVNNSTGKAQDTLEITDEASRKTCIEFMKSGPLPGYTNKMYCYLSPATCPQTTSIQDVVKEIDNWKPPSDGVFRTKFTSQCYRGKRLQNVNVNGQNTSFPSIDCNSSDIPCDQTFKKVCEERSMICIPTGRFEAYCGNTSSAADAPAAAGQANGISSTACSAQQKQLCDTEPWQPKGGCVITTTGLRQCKYEASREGDRCNNDPAHPETGAACGSKECRIIDGLPRCITNTCTQGEKTGCEAKGATCEIGTKKIDGVDKSYTYCKPGTTPTAPRPAAGAPAAPQSNTGQRPQSAQAPSTTKTPWDNDADNNKSLQNIEVLKYAARATSGSTDNASDAIDAARKARAAYLNGFDEGYSKVYIGKTISNDADARKERDIQANFVAIHAYIAKEFPGVSWEEAKQKGYDKRALDNLRRAETGWVIPQNATVDLSQIKAPNAVPTAGTPSTPQRLTIDPTVAVNCGTDLDGTQIPCYQIGVFASFDDLKATEAQASIASKRYELSQKILNEAKERVKNDALIAAAQAKLDAAKAKAAACMPK